MKFGTQHNATVDVTASQLVFNGSYIVALQASKVYLQLAQNQQEKKEIDVRETVANTYHLVLLAEKNRQILGSSLENLRQTWQETDAMHRAGFSEATAVDQLQLAVSDLENTLATTERQIETAYRLLKLQMGVDPDRPVALSDTLASILAAMDAELPAPEIFDLSRHIDFRVMETQERSMAMLLKREKAEYLPTVTAFFSLSQSAMRDRFNFFGKGGDWFPATILGFNLSAAGLHFRAAAGPRGPGAAGAGKDAEPEKAGGRRPETGRGPGPLRFRRRPGAGKEHGGHGRPGAAHLRRHAQQVRPGPGHQHGADPGPQPVSQRRIRAFPGGGAAAGRPPAARQGPESLVRKTAMKKNLLMLSCSS